MRISVRIAAGGNRALTRLPLPRRKLQECLNERGKIDRAKAQLAFAPAPDDDFRPFTPASTDDDAVYFAVLTFSELLEDAFADVAADPNADVSAGAVTRQDQHLERRFEKKRFVYARVNFRRNASAVRASVGVDNPQEIVGQSETEAWCFAKTAAQLLLRMAQQIAWLSVECPERPEIIDEARESNDAAALRRDHAECANRVNGYCSPMSPTCPFYRKGQCMWGRD